MIDVYGLKNCDTCKKATVWLSERGIEYVFHDVRAEPLDAKTIDAWLKELGSTTLVNRRSTTWRELTPAQKDGAGAAPEAGKLILDHPALMKRPVFDLGRERLVGFTAEIQKVLNKL
ncbi:MAG: Spx/MgsR family RNA polymerase-binding regulatory protein [Alphaproteobacteria bacterium]